MWGENWVVSFWLWGVWICMMAVGFSSSLARFRAATHYLWTRRLSQEFITTPVYPCVFVRVCVRENRRVVTDCQINNLAEHFSTGLRVCASLIGSQSVHQKRVSECFTGTRKQPWIVAYNFRTMPIEKCFSFVVIQLRTDRNKAFRPSQALCVACTLLVCFLNGPYYMCMYECQWGRADWPWGKHAFRCQSALFLSFSFLKALLVTNFHLMWLIQGFTTHTQNDLLYIQYITWGDLVYFQI